MAESIVGVGNVLSRGILAAGVKIRHEPADLHWPWIGIRWSESTATAEVLETRLDAVETSRSITRALALEERQHRMLVRLNPACEDPNGALLVARDAILELDGQADERVFDTLAQFTNSRWARVVASLLSIKTFHSHMIDPGLHVVDWMSPALKAISREIVEEAANHHWRADGSTLDMVRASVTMELRRLWHPCTADVQVRYDHGPAPEYHSLINIFAQVFSDYGRARAEVVWCI